MVKIKNVGINHGDCFFIEIENDADRCIIMVDGRKGDGESFNEIREMILEYKRIDYLIVTHIDNDHIKGILKVFSLPETDLVRQAFYSTVILYNYVTKPIISYTQAREFEKLIQNNTVISTVKKCYEMYSSPCLKILSVTKRKVLDPWEQKDYGKYAVLTILHPHKEGIEDVYKDFIIHPDKSSNKVVNKNSVVFLLEYGEHAALFTGDCFMKDIIDEIDQLKNMKSEKGFRKIDLIKIPHHGSYYNNEELAEFAKRHRTREFIVTGSKDWNKRHPSIKVLKELDEIVDDTNRIVIHTHVGLSMWCENKLKHTIVDKNDSLEWSK